MVSIAIIEPVLDLITAELAAEGALAVVVMGSFARGDASPHLYVLAAQAARDVFDAAQQAIVDHACALAEMMH